MDHGSKQMVLMVGYFVVQRCTQHRCPLGCGPHKVGSLSRPAAGTHTAGKHIISMTFLAGALRDPPLHCDPSQQQLRHSTMTVCQQLHHCVSNILSFGSCPIWECMSCKIRIGNPESNDFRPPPISNDFRPPPIQRLLRTQQSNIPKPSSHATAIPLTKQMSIGALRVH